MNAKKILAGMIGVMLLIALPAHARDWDVEQKGKVFLLQGEEIDTLKIGAGDVVRFHNHDPFFHNIFSLSKRAAFDLGVFKKGETREKVFTAAGVYEIECAIHPAMALRVEVQ